jgi:hypothetical protein
MISEQLGPETRMMPMAPGPAAVATAAIVALEYIAADA